MFGVLTDELSTATESRVKDHAELVLSSPLVMEKVRDIHSVARVHVLCFEDGGAV